jgi:hypothetical protein
MAEKEQFLARRENPQHALVVLPLSCWKIGEQILGYVKAFGGRNARHYYRQTTMTGAKSCRMFFSN